MSDVAVSVRGLRKAYGSHLAVRGIDLEIRTGEVLGLLGPNGAGKTTTVEILEGYRLRDAGEVLVLGEDPREASRAWRERIGVVLQSSSLYPQMQVHEILSLFAGYYQRSRDVGEVLAIVGLEEKRDARVRTLSGGQKRRVDLGLALVGDPDLVFLDEPTTGFDPAARRQAWEMIRGLRTLGKTILLTTHYMEEAQQLCDRLAVLREGEIVSEGTPAELTGAAAEAEIRYRAPAPDGASAPWPGAHGTLPGGLVVLRTAEPTRVLAELTARAVAEGRELDGLEVRRPTLEDVYLSLTADEDVERA